MVKRRSGKKGNEKGVLLDVVGVCLCIGGFLGMAIMAHATSEEFVGVFVFIALVAVGVVILNYRRFLAKRR